MTLTLYFENHWIKHRLFTDYSLFDIGYQSVNLKTKQHTFTFIILNLGFSVSWESEEKKKKAR